MPFMVVVLKLLIDVVLIDRKDPRIVSAKGLGFKGC